MSRFMHSIVVGKNKNLLALREDYHEQGLSFEDWMKGGLKKPALKKKVGKPKSDKKKKPPKKKPRLSKDKATK